MAANSGFQISLDVRGWPVLVIGGNEEAAEKAAYAGHVRPSRLKFSMKPKLPKTAWWRPRQKLSFVVQ